MSIFQLTLCLRVRYLVYSVLTFVGYLAIATAMLPSNWYIPGTGFVGTSAIPIVCATFVAFYLQTDGIKRAKEFYNYNKVGKGRAARVLIRHRDVMQIDTSWKEQWKATKRYCLFLNVIPANLFGLGVLLGILIFLNQGMDVLPFAVATGFFLLGGLSVNYAADHLCSVEVEELYSNHQTYDSAITQSKQ
jgi:hypothetical protein